MKALSAIAGNLPGTLPVTPPKLSEHPKDIADNSYKASILSISSTILANL
jgi:hypothetical protein